MRLASLASLVYTKREVREMITNDQELRATKERMEFFYQTVASIREKATSPEEYREFSNSYLEEMERMHREIMQYLHCFERGREVTQ